MCFNEYDNNYLWRITRKETILIKVRENLKKGTVEMVLLHLLSERSMYGYEILQEMSLLYWWICISPSISNNKSESKNVTKNRAFKNYSTFCTDSVISISAFLPMFEPISNT